MKFFRKNDLLIIASLLALSLVTYMAFRVFPDQDSLKAEIYYYDKLITTVELGRGTDRTFSIPEDPNVVFHLYADGGICFEESDCPDKVCIRSGILKHSGQFAACLPNGIVLRLKSSDEDNQGPDMVVGQ